MSDQVLMDRDDLKELIRGEVKAGFGEVNCNLTCPISNEGEKHISHTLDMMMDVGDGDVSKGIEIMRGNHNWTKKTRSHAEKIGDKVIMLALAALTAGFFSAFWAGFKFMAGSTPK